MAITCPACNAQTMRSFFKVPSVPTNSCLLFETAEEAASYPCGEVDLGFCDNCGFISNMAFDEKLTEYSGRYEETQGYSGTFNRWHEALAKRLIDRHDLRGKRVIEIGCGKGEFLELLAEHGDVNGVGFDPGFHAGRLESEAAKKLEFVTDFYSEKYVDYSADFVCCKMTLEHIHSTEAFLGTVRRAIGDDLDTIVFFQIPEAGRIVEDCAFEDIYYEHCSYFTPGSVARLFRKTGFEVLDVDTEYDDQYLTIEAKPLAPSAKADCTPLPKEESVQVLAELVNSFPERCNAELDEWRGKLADLKAKNAKVVLWGSGSKAVAFLTTLDPEGFVEYCVDINPRRHDHYMPKTAQRIVGPDFLKEYQPDTVIIMNRIYTDEITQDLNEMGLNPTIHAL